MSVVDGSTLSAVALVELIEGVALSVDAGLDLLDADDTLIEDISADLVADGSRVSRGMLNTVHGSCQLGIARQLVWGSQRVRPYLLLSSDGDVWYRWNLGVYVLATPEMQVGVTPQVWLVDGFDKLDVLNTPLGATVSVASGATILAAVEDLIAATGETRVSLDQASAAEVAATVRVFSVVDDWSTLTVCNDLLASIGYRGLWVDRDGVIRSGPYVTPEDLPSVWSYSTASSSTSVLEDRTVSADYYGAANVIVAIRDSVDDTLPLAGDGMFTLTNQSDGLTSIDGRGGRVVRRVIRGDWATQSALEAAAAEAMDGEKRVANFVSLAVSANPVHAHFDVVTFRDDAIPTNGRYLVTDWELPLDGADMLLTLRAV
jgi:hypothetical protein